MGFYFIITFTSNKKSFFLCHSNCINAKYLLSIRVKFRYFQWPKYMYERIGYVLTTTQTAKSCKIYRVLIDAVWVLFQLKLYSECTKNGIYLIYFHECLIIRVLYNDRLTYYSSMWCVIKCAIFGAPHLSIFYIPPYQPNKFLGIYLYRYISNNFLSQIPKRDNIFMESTLKAGWLYQAIFVIPANKRNGI